jgi:hypothetical protein
MELLEKKLYPRQRYSLRECRVTVEACSRLITVALLQVQYATANSAHVTDYIHVTQLQVRTKAKK